MARQTPTGALVSVHTFFALLFFWVGLPLLAFAPRLLSTGSLGGLHPQIPLSPLKPTAGARRLGDGQQGAAGCAPWRPPRAAAGAGRG